MTIVQGQVQNSNQEYIVFAYRPRVRGCFNYDDFKNLGTRLDEKGQFKFTSENISNQAGYSLSFKGKGLSLVLNKGDKLNLEFDIDNPQSSLFATGKGSAKINILNLKQFKTYIFYDTAYSVEEYYEKVDSIIIVQEDLLNAIRNKNLENSVVQQADNRDIIERIINKNTISKEEFRFIENILLTKKLALSGFISYLSDHNKLDSTIVDFSDPIYESFNKNSYSQLTNLNDFRIANAFDNIPYLEFLKNLQAKGTEITYSSWNLYMRDTLYRDWIPNFIKSNFTTEVFDRYYVVPVAMYQTLGYDYTDDYAFLKEESTNQKYLKRVQAFDELLKDGLTDQNYNLGSDEYLLNKQELDELIYNKTEKPVFLVFWSARFSGSSIIPTMPAIINLEENIKEKFEVINICIDQEVNKNLWAARIIDNSWKGNHYFLPIEGNDSTLSNFNCNVNFN